MLKSLKCDLFLGAHGSYFGFETKYASMKSGAANPFIDEKGCAEFVSQKEEEFRTEYEKQRAAKARGP